MRKKILSKIEEIRRTLDLTQKQFGSKIGLAPNTICQYESLNEDAVVPPSLKSARAIANFATENGFEITAEEIMNDYAWVRKK